MFYVLVFTPFVLLAIAFGVWSLLQRYKTKKNVILLSKLDLTAIIDQQKKSSDDFDYHAESDFKLELIRAGITLKEYNEARLLFAVIGIIILVVSPIFLDILYAIIPMALGVLCIIMGGKIYIAIAKSERVEKINNDLGVFLDLVNVILEAGGSLKNAFFQVSNRAHDIIDEELLKEIAILEYEMTNYSTKKAYENLKNRVDSRDVDKIVDFLILSEETGIGVKNIFATQSDEMRQEKFYKIKGKVNTLNMYLMLVIFIFVLPAVIAFIVFPMMAGSLDFSM